MLLWVKSFSSGLFAVRFGYVWQDLRCCISVTRRFFNPLGFNICLSLISAAEGWNEGHAGFRPTCLLWGLPPLFPPPVSFEGFFTFLRELLFWEQVVGWAHGRPCGIPEFFPTAHIIHSSSVHTWDVFTAVNQTVWQCVITLCSYAELKPDHFCIFLWFFEFSPRFTLEWAISRQLILFTTEIDSVLVTVM